MEYLDAYERVSARELAVRVGVVGTGESEWPAGDTKSSESSYALMQEDAIQLGNFNRATSYMLDMDNIRLIDLRSRIGQAGRSLRARTQNRREQIELTAQIDALKEEADMIEQELIDGPQR